MPVAMRVTYDDHGLADRLRQWPDVQREAIKAGLRDVADDVFAASQRNVPVDKGTLKKSGSVVETEGSITVGYNTPYARYVHDGTAAHIILPRLAKVLAFPPSGARGVYRGGQRVGLVEFGGRKSVVPLVFARAVHHPGTKAQPYLADAVTESQPRWHEYVARRIRQAWERLKGGGG